MFWSNPRLFLNWSARLKITSGPKLSIFCRSRSRLSKMARCSVGWPSVFSAARTFASVFQSSVFISLLRSWSIFVGRIASNRARTLIFFFTSLGPFEFAGEKIIHDQRRDERSHAEILLRIIVENEEIQLVATIDQAREQFVHPEFFLVRPLADGIQEPTATTTKISCGRDATGTSRRRKQLTQIGIVKIGISIGVEFSFPRVIGLQFLIETIIFRRPIGRHMQRGFSRQ